MIGLLPGWRPRGRVELIEWITQVVERLACAALRHPLTPSYGSSFALCHCTRRRVDVEPSPRRE